jgi:hypothetical protein
MAMMAIMAMNGKWQRQTQAKANGKWPGMRDDVVIRGEPQTGMRI